MDLISLNLVLPSMAALKENKHGNFDLVLKGDCDTQALTNFIAERSLTLEVDKGNVFYIISKSI